MNVFVFIVFAGSDLPGLSTFLGLLLGPVFIFVSASHGVVAGGVGLMSMRWVLAGCTGVVVAYAIAMCPTIISIVSASVSRVFCSSCLFDCRFEFLDLFCEYID